MRPGWSPFQRGLCLGVGLLLASCVDRHPPAMPERYFDDFPDLSQQGADFRFAGGGVSLCAPVAASNALTWLENNRSPVDQIKLVDRLSGPGYMGTSPHGGTPPAGVLRGIERYLTVSGRSAHRLRYAGWRPVAKNYRAGDALTVAWLAAGLGPRSMVLLNLGWYETPFPGVYRRTGGHWVSMVGYRQGRVAINDPGPWADGVDPQWLAATEVRPLYLKAEGKTFLPGPGIIRLEAARSPGNRDTYVDGAVVLTLDEVPGNEGEQEQGGGGP